MSGRAGMPLIPVWTIVSAILLLLATLIDAGDKGAVPSSEATEIGKIICTPEEFHDEKWFKCIECCQSINAYYLNKPNKECNQEARAKFCKTPDLTHKTRTQVCVGMKAYNMVLKKVVLELKGNIKPECATAEGMEALFSDKVACFKACADKKYDDANIKKYCPKFAG